MTACLPKLLIVDDEENIRRLLLAFLEDYEEFDLHGAHSGEEGLEIMAATPMDLCVVDMRLPDMTGETFILATAQLGLCSRFILHTGSVGLTVSPELRALGITRQDVFLKPCSLELLLERIRQRLQPPRTDQ